MDDEWRPLAACLDMDTNLFFVRRGDYRGMEHAKAICLPCPVKAECLEAAIHEEAGHDVNHWIAGVRGGKSAKQRRVMYQTMGVCGICHRIYERQTRAFRYCSEECRAENERRRKRADMQQRRAS